MRLILFVCVENTFRSILSEAIFNSRAPAGWRAESAGVNRASSVNPAVFWLLREIGINLEPRTPRLAAPEMTTNAWRVVTFGCLDRCPAGTDGKSEDWPLPGSTGKSDAQLREIRDEISRRVDRLINEIVGSRHP